MPFLFEQVAFVVILCLLAVELVSYLLLTRPFSKLISRLKDILRFKRPWEFFVILTWLLLAFLSILYFNNSSPVDTAFLVAGIATFIQGWLIIHQYRISNLLAKRFRAIRPLLFSYSSLWSKIKLHDMHARLFGPWLEIVGISLIAKSIIFFPAFFLFPLILGTSIIQHGKKLARTNPDITPPAPKDLIPKPGHILLFTLIPLSLAIIVGISTREFAIFYNDVETAKSVLFTLSQIEGSIGVLAITIIFVLTQLTASNYSIRVSAILFRQPAFWTPLIILVGSITYNLLVASRSPMLLPNAGYFHSLIVDFSFVFAFITACSIAYFIFKAPGMVSPESIIANSLESFDKEWLDTIKRDWCRPNFQIKLNVRYDPFIVIERILSRAVDSGDSLTFVSGLILIRDHLRKPKTIDPQELHNYIIEVDAYLRHHFRSLVRNAAKNSDAYTLLQLIHFSDELGSPSPESITTCNTFAFGFDEAAGELLLREIIRQAAAYQLIECVTRGLHIVEGRAMNVIKTLPDQKDTWRYDPSNYNAELSEEKMEGLWANDFRIENFERQYFSYLESLGIKAADSKSTEILRSVIFSLNTIISFMIQHVEGHVMKAMMVGQAVRSLDEIRKTLVNNELAEPMALSMLNHAAEHANAKHDEAVAWYLVHYVSGFLLGHAKLGLLHYMNVVDSAMFGLRIVEKYTKPATHLLESFGEAAKLLKQNKSFTEDKGLQFVYNEIIQRIRQVGHAGPRKDPAQISSTIRSILTALNEPEFEERRKA